MPTKSGKKVRFILTFFRGLLCHFDVVSMFLRIIRCKITKKFKNFKIYRALFAKFGHISHFLYLCSVKRIAYILPIKHLRGNISGRQEIDYDGHGAYDIPAGDVVSSGNYQSRMVAKVLDVGSLYARPYFQVRTRQTVNMSPAMKRNLALMGGSGAMYAALVLDKIAPIYIECMRVCPANLTLRQFMVPILRGGLAAKSPVIAIADGVTITNPWVYSGDQTLTLKPSVLAKFASELSNT